MKKAGATCSPSRFANSDRPFATDSPLQRRADDAEETRGHHRVEHHGRTAARRLGGAQQPGGAIDAIVGAALAEIELGRIAADREAVTGLGLIAVVGQRADD